MRATLAVSLLLSSIACSTSHLGACTRDADCPAYATCDSSRSVCVIKRGVCFPACDAGHVCDPATQTCQPVTSPSVAVTSPAAGGYATGTLQAAAVALAPGGVTGLTFNLSSGASVVASASGAVSPSDPSSWSAAIPLASVADGAVDLAATLTYSGGSATSAKVSLTVDQTPPSISMQTDGRTTLYSGGQTDTVVASITDALSGVRDSTVTLVVNGHSIPGVAGAGGTYSFPVLIDDTVLAAGTSAPVAFSVTAGDNAGNTFTLSGDPKEVIRADRRLVSISIFADSTPYARTAIPVPVSALITSSAGVPDGGAFLNGTVAPSFRDGGFFTFPLDARGAPAGVEGPYGFQVSAADNASNTAGAGGTLIIDDAPPDASVRVFKGTDPGGDAGVTYPAAVPGTGWDGTQFVYSDTVHVKGTIADVSGIRVAALHIDYVQIDGGVSAGAAQVLPCTVGQTLCTFDVQVALNAPTNGRFDTFTRGKAMGDIVSAPVDNFKVVISANDAAKSANGADAAHSGTSSRDAQTTRLLWQMYLPASVSGLGIHPNGDLIVTLDGGTDTVIAMWPDDGGVDWHWGFDAGASGMGPIDGTPAIGSGTATTALVYVAGETGEVYALSAGGAATWHYSTGDRLVVGPAVNTATIATVAVDEVLIPDATATKKIYAVAAGALVSSAGTGDVDLFSAPFVMNGNVYFGTNSKSELHSINSAGQLGGASQHGSTALYREMITDGTSIFDWRILPGPTTELNARDASLAFLWSTAVTPTGAGAVALDARIIVSLSGGEVRSFDPNPAGTGASNLLFNLGGSGLAPLIGWDGNGAHEHFYLPRSTGGTYAYDSLNTLAWRANPNGAPYRAFAMDCAGRLFGASNATAGALLAGGNKSIVYALITDDRGLADTMWPSYRLDARNTGNAASTYGILRTGGACSQ